MYYYYMVHRSIHWHPWHPRLVTVEKAQVRRLQKAFNYYVELGVYTETTRAQPIPDSISYQEIDGKVVPCVLCAGSTWRDAFENGMPGVYRVVDETTSAVTKTSHVNDPELDLEPVDKIFDRMRATIFGEPESSVNRLDALLDSTSMPVAQQTTSPKVPAIPEQPKDVPMDKADKSPWASFRVRSEQPQQALAAKAKAKQNAKRKPKEVKENKESTEPTTENKEPKRRKKDSTPATASWINLDPTAVSVPTPASVPNSGPARVKTEASTSDDSKLSNQYYLSFGQFDIT